MRVIKSSSTEPEVNFALERELLARRDDVLLLYIDSPCVVTGRNQNPAAEADLEWCARERIPVLRRMSGGGAVYHDSGNVNFAFITSTGSSPPLDNSPLCVVAAALRSLDIEATAGARGELTVGGKKISGTASCVRSDRRLFHGTLLFDTDLTMMKRALAGDTSTRGRKVASVPAQTANLKPLMPKIESATAFMDSLADFFTRHYGGN
jgi:lipoate-protein ligase A